MKKHSLRKKITILTAFTLIACGGAAAVSAEPDLSTEEGQRTAALIEKLSEKEQPGDINGDGIINVFDVMRYKNTILEGREFDQAKRIDANSDGDVNIKDISAVKNDILKQSKLWSYKSVPKMDGSTSAIPLEAGLKSKMLGVSYSDAKLLVSHHKTHESFQMLLSGENDMIFTVPISEDQKKAADEAGVKLNFVPVAKEGFVFVVNRSNPVDSLTSAQIRDIYSGKITNWKEVGGNDEKIVPYQRNKDSGSQNYMTEFMEGYDLMDPPKTYILGSMSSLMDGLAVYDNAENAIGYSVYSYAAQMYENSSDTKFIAVDGIKPTRETMADGTYPLLSSTSIVYTDKASQNTKDFAEWAVSEEGQKTVLSCGYVPVKDMEYPAEMKPYYAKGTGKEKPKDYKPAEKYSVFNHSVFCAEGADGILPNGDCFVYYLKDEELQKKINEDIESTVFKGGDFLPGDWGMDVKIFNGYMNISFCKNSSLAGDYLDPVYVSDQDIELNYDLKTGKKIEKFSDLFYKDTDFVPLVNKRVGEYLSVKYPENLKTDYIGLLGDAGQFSFTSVMPGAAGTYFDRDTTVPFQGDYNYELIDSMITGEYFDCREIINEEYAEKVYDNTYTDWIKGYTSDSDGNLHYNFTSRFHTEEEINAKNQFMEKILEKTKPLVAEEYPKRRELTANGLSVVYGSDSETRPWINAVMAYVPKGSDQGSSVYMFDPETLEQIKRSDIFGETFEKYDSNDYGINSISLDGGTVAMTDFEWKQFSVKIDFEKLNMKYILAKEAPVTERKWRKNAVVSYGQDGIVESFPETYVKNYGAKEAYLQVSEGTKVKIINNCSSHGKLWCECRDAEKEDVYYGWIASENLITDDTEEELAFYEKYHFRFMDDHPLRMDVSAYNQGDLYAYSDAFITDTQEAGDDVMLHQFTDYTDLTARTKCLSRGEWWYECWDTKTGEYYGWVRDKDINYGYSQPDSFNCSFQPISIDVPIEGTLLGSTFGGVECYNDEFIVDYRIDKPLTVMNDDFDVTIQSLCYSHGELWYNVVAGGTPDGYVWVNACYIEEK